MIERNAKIAILQWAEKNGNCVRVKRDTPSGVVVGEGNVFANCPQGNFFILALCTQSEIQLWSYDEIMEIYIQGFPTDRKKTDWRTGVQNDVESFMKIMNEEIAKTRYDSTM